MGRILLEYGLPIILPSLLYLAWVAYENRRVARGGIGKAPRWQEGPWLWLAIGGIIFAAILAAGLAVLGMSGTQGVYVPPRVEEGGRVIPGHVEPGQASPPARRQ